MLGALIGGGLGLLGGMMANESREDESASNRAFQERMSNTSYQRAMEDMRKAGLNPMLAYSQGGASVPAGSMAQFENPMASAAQAFSAVASGQSGLVSSGASAQQAETAASIGDATIQKTKQEITNLKSENERVQAVTRNLFEEYQNLIKTGWNLTEAGNQLRASTEKLVAELPVLKTQAFLNQVTATLREAQTSLAGSQTALTNLDVEAANSLGNIGREAGQVAPILKILIDVIRNVR